MNKILKKLFALIFICNISTFALAQTIPERSNTIVTDYTNTLTAAELQFLEQKLSAFNDTSSTQIAVVLVPDLQGDEVQHFAYTLAEKWGIGQKGKNNGILLLAAINDRKVTIQVGYGLEAVMTDALSRRIIEQDLKPNFKSGNYFAGIDSATNHIIAVTKGEYKAEAKVGKGGNWGKLILIAIIIIIFLIVSSRGKGGQQISSSGSSLPLWLLLGATAGRGGNNSWGNFSGGGGGGSSFGGFGGGSFGGGGASGDW